MSSTRSNVLRRARVIAAAVTAATAFAIPTATAGAGPPQGGGGCHMVSSPSSTFHMMAGSGNGRGAGKMGEMLSRFSPDPFCGF